MKKANNLKAPNIDQPKDAGNRLAAIEEVIAKAGGVAQLARSLSVSRSEINRWQKKGAVPMNWAMIIARLYATPWEALVSDEDAMWISLMQLERLLGVFNSELTNVLKQTTAVIDTMFKLRGEAPESA